MNHLKRTKGNYMLCQTKNKVLLLITCLLTITTLTMSAGTKKKVHTIGDSTMSNYATDGSTDKRGWGQMLQQFFNPANVIVNNRGKAGASSKSFYKEQGYWQTLRKGGKDEMQSGDFLLIQFAHNDEKTNGTDGEELKRYYILKGAASRTGSIDYRGTTASDTYKEYMRAYINEAKEMGVKPIIVAPICRKYFSTDGKTITRAGRHDLGDKFSVIKNNLYLESQKVSITDHTYDYVAAAKAVANEFDDVPFIDLTSITANMYLKFGQDYCTKNLFCSSDKTHTSALGATLIAREFAIQLKKQAETETNPKKKAVLAELAKDVDVSNRITINPTTGDMGDAYVGTDVSKDFTISAFDMPEESGRIKVYTVGDYLVSKDKNNWEQSIFVDYTGNNLQTTVYAKPNNSVAGVITGKLAAVDSTNTIGKSIPLSINSVTRVGGEDASCSWSLFSTSLSASATNLNASEVTLEGMKATAKFATPTSPAGHTMMLLFDTENGTWPSGESDEVSTRYIEFKATVPYGKMFYLSDLSLDICAWGANTNCYHIYYATKSDFSDQELLGEGIRVANKKVYTVSKSFLKKVAGGESVYIRVYPWMSLSDPVSNKYLGISDVTISGKLLDAPVVTAKTAKKPAAKNKAKARK